MRTLILVAVLLVLLASVAMAGPPTPMSLTTATLTTTWSTPAAVAFARASGAEDAVLIAASIAGVVPVAPAACRDVGTLTQTAGRFVAITRPEPVLGSGTTATTTVTTDDFHLVAADDVGATPSRIVEALRPPEGRVVVNLTGAVGFVRAC